MGLKACCTEESMCLIYDAKAAEDAGFLSGIRKEESRGL
jgi:hypothetical protein